MGQQAAKTGFGPATVVAIEQHFPEGMRLINDDVACRILPFSMKAYVWLTHPSWARDWMIQMSEKKVPGAWAMVICRKRYIDDKVTEALSGHIQTVINIGAGFDTLAYRLPVKDSVRVYEIDQPENISAKRSKLTKVFGTIPENVSLVSIDVDRQTLGDVLTSQGYAAETQTFFIVEGVTQYLAETGIQSTFNFLGIAPEEVPGFLSIYGWRVREHHGYAELSERYIKPTGRKLQSLPIERVVYAEKS